MPEFPDSVVPIRDGGSRPPLHCVHPVSGSAYSYLPLASLLDEDQPIYGFEAPGYDDDRPPATSLADLSAEYVSILRAADPDTPVSLLGWSLGGVVAFDMALRLTALGVEVPRLVLVDAEVPVKGPLPSERAMQQKFVQDLLAIDGSSPPEVERVFAGVAEEADPVDTFARVERSGLFPEEVDAELLCHRFAIFRTHVAALFDFEVTEPHSGPVTVIRAAATPPEWMDWSPWAPCREEHVLDGDHHSIWTGDALARLGRIVAASLPS